MGRVIGQFPFSGNLELQKGAPIDARTVVEYKSDLISVDIYNGNKLVTPSIWRAQDGSKYLYKGLVVYVIETNELYTLIDDDNYSNDDYSAWKKIASDAEIKGIIKDNEEVVAHALNDINEHLSECEYVTSAALTELDAKITTTNENLLKHSNVNASEITLGHVQIFNGNTSGRTHKDGMVTGLGHTHDYADKESFDIHISTKANNTGNYGHVILETGDLSGKTYIHGVAASIEHEHKQYTDNKDFNIHVGTKATDAEGSGYGHVRLVKGDLSGVTKTTFGDAAASYHSHGQYANKTDFNKLKNDFNTLVSGDTSTAIESFKEITDFLKNIEDTENLDSIIAGIRSDKQNKISSIALSGDVTGTTTVNGATAITIDTFVKDNSHSHISSNISDAVENGSDITRGQNSLVKGKAVFAYVRGEISDLTEEFDSKLDDLTNEIIDNEYVIASSLSELEHKIDILGVNEVTYDEIYDLLISNSLIPGAKYRITDYVTTCVTSCVDVMNNNMEIRSAEHQFDIVVTALHDNKLDENAKVMLHEGDTYFANNNLDKWEIKYSLENDNEKYKWADTVNGKGVIYYMKDEHNNEAYYDFKNILFKRSKTDFFDKNTWFNAASKLSTSDRYFYTFTRLTNAGNTIKDSSVYYDDTNTVYYSKNNKISNSLINSLYLNNIVFINNLNCTAHNIIGSNCCNNTFGDNCSYNTIGDKFYNNVIGNNFSGNTLVFNIFNNKFIAKIDNSKFNKNISYCGFGINNTDTIEYCDFGSMEHVNNIPSINNVVFCDHCIVNASDTSISSSLSAAITGNVNERKYVYKSNSDLGVCKYSNIVTLNGAQTITGSKTFNNSDIILSKNGGVKSRISWDIDTGELKVFSGSSNNGFIARTNGIDSTHNIPKLELLATNTYASYKYKFPKLQNSNGEGVVALAASAQAVSNTTTAPICVNSSSGYAFIKVGDNSGMTVTNDTIAIKVGSGLYFDKDGITVKVGSGLKYLPNADLLNSNNHPGGIGINMDGNTIKEADNGKIYVNVGTGLKKATNGNGGIELNFGSGLYSSGYEPLQIKLGAGLKYISQDFSGNSSLNSDNTYGGIGVNIRTKGGLVVDSNNQIAFDNDGNTIDINSSGKVYVKLGCGLSGTTTGIKVRVGSCLYTDSDFFGVGIGDGLTYTDGKNENNFYSGIKINYGKGLKINGGKICVKPIDIAGHGLFVMDDDKVVPYIVKRTHELVSNSYFSGDISGNDYNMFSNALSGGSFTLGTSYVDDASDPTIHYMLSFKTHATSLGTFSFPASIKWVNNNPPVFEKNKNYLISIVNNLGTYGVFDV